MVYTILLKTKENSLAIKVASQLHFCPNWLDWPALVSPALKRTRCKIFFGYFLLFYRSNGFKKTEIWKYISFCHLNPKGTGVPVSLKNFNFWLHNSQKEFSLTTTSFSSNEIRTNVILFHVTPNIRTDRMYWISSRNCETKYNCFLSSPILLRILTF